MTAPRPSVLSIVRGADAGAARTADPALDANAYAIANDVDLTLVLKDRGVELGLDTVCGERVPLRGLAVPAARPGVDLRALLDSGARVHAVLEDLQARGIAPESLIPGIQQIREADLGALITSHDVTLTTSS